MSHEYSRRGRNWFTAMGVLFIVMALIIIVRNMILWSPGFFYDFLVGPEITNEKFSVAMIIGVFVGTYSSIYIASPSMMFLTCSSLRSARPVNAP